MPASEPSLTRRQGAAGRSWRRVLFALARLGVGIGLIVYLAESGLIHLADLERLFLAAWPLTLAALTLLLLHMVLISWRLCLLFRPQGLRLPFITSLRLTLIGLFFEIFLPGAAGSTAAKLFYATRENKGGRTQVATVVLFDRAVGIFSLLLLPLIFSSGFLLLISRVHVLRIILIAYAAICSFLTLVLLSCLWFQSALHRLARIIPYPPARDITSRVLETIGGYRKSLATLFSAFGLSLLANLCIVGVIALGVLVVNPPSVAWRLCLIVPIGQIVNSLPLTPGGLGVGEIAFNTLFKLSGLSGGAEAVLCWRVWGALVSSIGLFFYLRGMERSIVKKEPARDGPRVPGTRAIQRSARA